jgi:hypothetical protein
MRTFFLKRNTGIKTRNHWLSFALALGFMAFANISNAQVDMSWTGASSNNFVIEDNWDPAGDPNGNNLTVPMQTDSSLAPYAIEVSGAEDIAINWLEIEYATEDQYQPTVTINMDSDETLFEVSTGNASNCDYNYTGIILKQGHYKFTKTNGPRVDSDNSWLKVEGGVAEFANLLMGNSNNPSSGGKIYISGDGEVRLNDTFGRIHTAREDGQVEIIEDGILNVNGNFEAPTENWINGGENYSIARSYDAVANKTTFSAVPASFIGIENSNRQVLKSGVETTDTLQLIQTNAVVEASTFEWRYRVEGEETYTSFNGDAANEARFAPVFETPGTFLVSCVVDGEATENEVEFFIVSSSISFSPEEFSVQFVRVGETGAEITAEFTTDPTEMEWKYATIPGGPYESFDPAETTATISPSFDSTGNHYVVMIAEIDGTTHTSVELFYNVEDVSSSGKSLTWSGLVSEEGTNPANWDPVANPYRNSLAVGAFDSLSNKPYPVYEPVGNDTIYYFWVGPGATMTVNTEDSINIRGSWQQAQGKFIVENGIINNKGYFRLDKATGEVQLLNDSKLIIENLLMGDRTTDGGIIVLEDNAILHCINLPGRVSADTLQSVTYISDNASIEYEGDVQADVTVWINEAKIVCPDEGFEPYVTFNTVDSLTIVTARNLNAFALDNADLDMTTPGTATSTEIGLVNVEGVTNWEWKWSDNVNGPWNSFDPAATDVTSFAPSFNEAGDYYVVAVTSGDVQTTNIKQIKVVDLSVTPADSQIVAQDETAETLTVNIPEEVTLSGGMWLVEDETGYLEETGIADASYTPSLFTPGTFNIYYYAEVQDAEGNPYTLYSNKVVIEYGSTGVNQMDIADLEVFPNPTSGTFHFNANFESNYTVEIFNIAGSLVYKNKFTDNGMKSITFNKKGVYMVKVQADEQIQMSRLIVK